jgi:hypothetical protein
LLITNAVVYSLEAYRALGERVGLRLTRTVVAEKSLERLSNQSLPRTTLQLVLNAEETSLISSFIRVHG